MDFADFPPDYKLIETPLHDTSNNENHNPHGPHPQVPHGDIILINTWMAEL